ncbi:hypothetical protein DC345_01055 [Paenibacillus taichungensis]|jgi:hypothetical protein|uniref:DUF3139 domain-containing protein n=1 Tax=Paenibacillus taichungensis TaxID=484184 RepID=A0A329R421_9BACL|nr:MULTISPECIES: DUF3139 domain-containing protein [Paenibacillus]RAW19397.1 hypothetical protein DC345_01055 [Paenibacillus taichungensis]
MKKKKKYVLPAVLIITVMLVLTPIIYVQVNKLIYAHRVTEYLIEEKKYTQEEIESVEGIWNVKLPPFSAEVTFKDEPDVEYIYFAHNEVLQFAHRISEEAQRRGKTKSDLKHVEPTNDRE